MSAAASGEAIAFTVRGLVRGREIAGEATVAIDGAGVRMERAELGFKGPTTYVDGFKVREDLGAPTGEAEQLSRSLEAMGYIVTRAIDRSISQY